MLRTAPRALRAIFCTALAATLSVPALAVPDIVFILDGIPGESEAAKGQHIELLSYSWGESRATGSSGAGRTDINTLSIAKPTDSASPAGVTVAAGDLNGDGAATPRKPTIGRATVSPKSLPGTAGANETLTVGSNQTESGLPTGKRQHKPFTLTQPLDRGSITVRMRPAGGCTVGKRYSGAQFSASGKTYVLSDVQVADCGGSTADQPTEEVTFVYGKVKVRAWDPKKKEE